MHIIADMHTHTIASGHAFGTLAENAAAAAARGLGWLAVTDHGPAILGASAALYFRCAPLVPEKLHGVRLLAGAEVNITDASGSLDLPDDIRAGLDFVLIGIHPYTCYGTGDLATNTAALLAALARPGIDCVAHADNIKFPVDLAAVVPAAARAGVIFEVSFLYLQIAVIRAVCVWCTSYGLSLILRFFVALIVWLRQPRPVDVEA